MPKKPPKKPKPRKPKPGGKKPKPRKPGGGRRKPDPDKPGRKRPGRKPQKPLRKPRRESRSGSIPQACRKFKGEPHLLDCWLEQNPKVANAIRWERAKAGGGSEVVAWPAWSASMKARLRDTWMAARAWRADGMHGHFGAAWTDPPPNQDADVDPPTTRTVLDGPTQAWPWYLAQVATCLAAEIEAWVPWSIRGHSVENLEHLLAGPRIFVRDRDNGGNLDSDHPGGYIVLGADNMEKATPAHPSYVWRWLAKRGIVAATRIDTIGNLLEWCRANMQHYLGSFTPENAEFHWQYRGYPPVRRVIEGTPYTDPAQPSATIAHRTGGCWGTTAFLRSVLRNANIPVQMRWRCGHTLPYFAGAGRYLSHGDDPYNALAKADFPAKDLLIGQAKFDAWFPVSNPQSEANEAACCRNVGRQTRELAIWHFGDYILGKYCADKAAGLSHADGQVFELFANKGYTVAQLEATDLWGRLDAEAAARGTC